MYKKKWFYWPVFFGLILTFMFATAPYKRTHIEGPYLNWVAPNQLQFTYLNSDSAKTLVLDVGKEEELRLPGQLSDWDEQYTISRNPKPAPAQQAGVEKILVLGDIHGTYRKLKKFLEKNEVIDGEGHWRWGKGQLVFSGDVLDRGTEVTEVLWLIYRLEGEAAKAGGAVHYLLGNHEIMVMEGDYRYVNKDYMELYENVGREYAEQFAENAVFGQWLRSRNTVIHLNDLLISHAGVSPLIAAKNLSIEEINRQLQNYLQNPAAIDSTVELLKGQQSPLWYRGYIMDLDGQQQPEQAEVEGVLSRYGASHMTVAHTTVDSVQARYDGKVFAVDLDVNEWRVPLEGLLYKEGAYYRLEEDGTTVKL